MPSRLAAVLAACTIAVFIGPPAHASCCCSTPVTHAFDSYFACADGRPVSALVYQISDPLVTDSGLVDIACESFQAGPCGQPQSGVAGDGAVTIWTDWVNPMMPGCPFTIDGYQRIVIVVRGDDGKGLVASISGRGQFGFPYTVEAAHRFEVASEAIFPLPCTDRAGQPRILAQTANPDGRVSLAVRFAPPLVYTDCDPDSVGLYVGACTDAFQANSALARIFTSVQPCNGPADLRRDSWSDTGIVPAADGTAVVTMTLPTDGRCALIGYSAMIGGFESGAIIGFVKVPGLGCPDRDGDGVPECVGDCNDADPSISPIAAETCNGLDDNCNGLIDEDALGADTDNDGVANLCDNCPTIPNRDQDPGACDQRVVDPTLSFITGPAGAGAASVTWSTTHEVDVQGFNLVMIDQQGRRIQQNDTLIPCQECVTGSEAAYTSVIPKHKSGRSIFIELVRRSGVVETYGPAARR